jgi:O-antigen/teichoic acid export membrane protein
MHVRELLSFSRYLFQWLSLSDGQLKERVFRGGAWLAIGNIFNRLAGLIKLGILARLLTPADFGLIGIAMVLIHWFEQFSQTGFNQALIRTSGDIRPYLNTLWTWQVLRGIALSLVLILAAPVAARFFGHPEALHVMQALAPLVFLRGLTNPAVVYLMRELDFRRVVFWNMWQVFSGLVVAIPMAVISRNVWALVLSLLVGQAVSTIVSYRIHAFRPRFALDWARVREMGQFGKWIFWKNLCGSVVGSIDSSIVAKLLGASALGMYQVALRIATFPTQQTLQVLSRVTYPAFAQLRQVEQLRRAYLQVLQFTLLLTLPMVALLFVFPELAVRLFLGSQWLEIVPLVPLLALAGGLQTLKQVAYPMFEGMGRPDVPVWMLGFRFVLSALFYPFTRFWGLPGIVLAVLTLELILTGVQFFFLQRLIGLSVGQGIATFWQGLATSLPVLCIGVLTVLIGPSAGVLMGLEGMAVAGCVLLMWFYIRPHLMRLQRPTSPG